jgi:hypothetical protein
MNQWLATDHTPVITIKGYVQYAHGHIHLFRMHNFPLQTLGQKNTTGSNAYESQPLYPPVPLQDLVSHSGQNTVNLFLIHQCYFFGHYPYNLVCITLAV